MRLSTIPGDILDDSVSTPRGLAIKIIGVQGERLEGSEADVTQDLVLVNGPAIGAPNAKQFLATLKMLAKTTDRAQGLKTIISGALRGVQDVIVAATGTPSATVATLEGQPETHILGETFYSQVPLRFGNYIAKVEVAPVSPELVALVQAPLNVQLRSGWSEKKSPYRAVARITVKPQAAWSLTRSATVDDGMSFSPWHGLVAHRPLGSIMRVRKMAYEMGRRFRSQKSGRSIKEPKGLVPFAD